MDSGGHFCIMLVGEYAPAFPASYVNPVDAAGISFFEIDESIILRSHRVARLMYAMGLDVFETPAELEEYACQQAEDMPVWPEEGSMIYENGLITVKMGESS